MSFDLTLMGLELNAGPVLLEEGLVGFRVAHGCHLAVEIHTASCTAAVLQKDGQNSVLTNTRSITLQGNFNRHITGAGGRVDGPFGAVAAGRFHSGALLRRT